MSGERDWIEDQNFSLVHKIILGVSDKRLEDELRENPKATRDKDAQGRTALDWATGRGQLDDMRLLLAYGSDPNSMDTNGRTTVLHAVDSHNYEALEIILEAGANPDPQVSKGISRSSPLVSASFGGLAEMTRLLLYYGADINSCNPEGRNALTTATSRGHHEVIQILSQWYGNLPR